MSGSPSGTPDMIWMRPQRQPSAPRATLSRDQITAVAVAIADARGVDAVSMRQVATQLGCGTMSLYRHVRTKDELLDLMIDAVVGEEVQQTVAPTGGWRASLQAMARARRATMKRHPWLAPVQAGRPCLGPNVVTSTEATLSAVADLGLSIDDMIRMIRTVDAFVQGFVQIELAEQEWRTPHDTALTGDEENWHSRTVAYLQHLSETGHYPQFTRMVTEAQPDSDPDADFEWQLNRILDGFATIIRHHNGASE